MASFRTLSYTPNNLLTEHYTGGVPDSVLRKVLKKIKLIYTPFYKLNLFMFSDDFMSSHSSNLIPLAAFFFKNY